jgi:copper transport protein
VTRRLAPIVLAGLALGMAPAAASAHALLEGTSPHPGQTVVRQPDAVVFRFDEPVEGTFGAVRVFDAHGARVDLGDAFHPDGVGSKIAVHLKAHLPQGTYTATYRVISADGHPVSSGFVFSIGRAGAAPSETVGQLIGRSKTGTATSIAFGAARAVQYAALAVALGGFLFLLAVWLPALPAAAGADRSWQEAATAYSGRARRTLVAAAIAGALSGAAGVVLEGATGAGISGWSALRPHVVHETLTTRFGLVWGSGAVVWALAAAAAAWLLAPARGRLPALRTAQLGATGIAAAPRPAAGRLAILGAPLAALALLPVYSGHASTQHPVGVLFPANLVHVSAMSLWLGGLVALLAVVPAATRRLEASDRSRLLAAVLVRFSPLALVAVIALALTGLVQAYVEVRTLDNVTATAFGRAVLIKLVLLLALICLGAYNRQRSVPRLRAIAQRGEAVGHAGVLLRRALRSEVALIAVVLGVTGALTGYAPSIAAHAGPFSATRTVGPAQLQLTIDPARVGANEMHLFLVDPRTGAQFTRAKEVDVAESLPAKRIGPLNQAANAAGPGHFIVPSSLLSVPGHWRIAVTVRVSDFDEYTTAVEVHVR